MTPEELSRLHGECFDFPRPWSAAEFTEMLRSENIFLRSISAAFSLGRVLLDEAELLTLAVQHNLRRQGVGRRLLLAFEIEAYERGARRAFLEVAANNAGAIALYSSCGYGNCGARPSYYRVDEVTRVDALLMEKTLRASDLASSR